MSFIDQETTRNTSGNNTTGNDKCVANYKDLILQIEKNNINIYNVLQKHMENDRITTTLNETDLKQINT